MNAETWDWSKAPNPHEVVEKLAETIRTNDAGRRDRLLLYLRMYGDPALKSYAYGRGRTSSRAAGRVNNQPARLSLNIVANMVDSFTSLHVKSKPHASVAAKGGDYSLHQIAREREKLIDGCFYAGDAYRLRSLAIRTATLLGDAFVQALPNGDSVGYEPVFPGEVLVDQRDGRMGKPRQMIRQACYDKAVAKAKFPKYAAAIDSCPQPDDDYFGRDTASDQVGLTEAWRLPDSPGKKGRHVIVCKGATLLDEKWESPRFPLVRWRYCESVLGYWTMGLAERLAGIQFEINSLLLTIQSNCYRGGNLKVLLERGSNIVDAAISNSLRVPVIRYTGTKPDFHTHDVVSPQIIAHLQYLVETAYQITGFGRLNAQGEVPAGLEGSGRAQLVYQKIESERFANFSIDDENSMRDLGLVTLDVAKAMGKDLQVTYNGKRWLDTVDVEKALSGSPNDFEMRMTPTSQLPHDIAGQMAIVDHLEQKGRIDGIEANRMLELQDLKGWQLLVNAPYELIDYMIEMILEKGEIIRPDPRMDLKAALVRGNLAFNRARLTGVPGENLDKLNSWLDLIQDELQKLAAPPPPAVAAPPIPGGMPGEAGAPPSIPGAPPMGAPAPVAA